MQKKVIYFIPTAIKYNYFNLFSLLHYVRTCKFSSANWARQNKQIDSRIMQIASVFLNSLPAGVFTNLIIIFCCCEWSSCGVDVFALHFNSRARINDLDWVLHVMTTNFSLLHVHFYKFIFFRCCKLMRMSKEYCESWGVRLEGCFLLRTLSLDSLILSCCIYLTKILSWRHQFFSHLLNFLLFFTNQTNFACLACSLPKIIPSLNINFWEDCFFL